MQTQGMTRYLASRFAGMLIVMALVATLVFFITRLAPGDPAAVACSPSITAAGSPGARRVMKNTSVATSSSTTAMPAKRDAR